jgi:hypothetical protein
MKKHEAVVNTIISEIQGLMVEEPPKDKGIVLSYISSIICQFDTDVAIEVMKEFGEEGKNQALSIKINYGY